MGDGAPRRQTTPGDPCVMVIFGATGDLTKRLLVPALYNLALTRALPDAFALIGVARGPSSAQAWRDRLRETLESFVGGGSEFRIDHVDEDAWARLAGSMSYLQGDTETPELYEKLGRALDEAARARGTRGNALFYLALADRLFGPVVESLGKSGLAKESGADGDERRYWRRVVIEKPFGHSLETARALDATLRKTLREDQIFRIDHFLGKETVQSLMAFRFANGLFEPIWNRERIDHVQITAAETLGVEGRGKFYEQTGALRDMIPNHMLTLLSMVAMEPPVGFDPDSVRSKKTEVLAAMPAVRPEKAVRGQYGADRLAAQLVRPYREEPDVARDSRVETYAAVEFTIDNWRWAGVPFYARTGKHLSNRVTEIAICFKPAPHAAFKDTPVECLLPNWLVLSIAPDKGISLQFDVKRNGPHMSLGRVEMEFHYDDWFPAEPNVGYETLIYDVMVGDATLFMRADMVEHTWRIIQPVLDAWNRPDGTPVQIYPSGSSGPREADALLADEGRKWRDLRGGGTPSARHR
jgi:glucose-6-phosphate 1-dehydrogenase